MKPPRPFFLYLLGTAMVLVATMEVYTSISSTWTARVEQRWNDSLHRWRHRKHYAEIAKLEERQRQENAEYKKQAEKFEARNSKQVSMTEPTFRRCPIPTIESNLSDQPAALRRLITEGNFFRATNILNRQHRNNPKALISILNRDDASAFLLYHPVFKSSTLGVEYRKYINSIWSSPTQETLSEIYDQDALVLGALKSGHYDLAQKLIASGISVYGRDYRDPDSYGETALLYAVSNPSIPDRDKLVRELLDNGADINAQTFSGSSALILAANRGDTAMVQLLLSKGANPNLRTLAAVGGTDAHEAALYIWGNKEKVGPLIDLLSKVSRPYSMSFEDFYGRKGLSGELSVLNSAEKKSVALCTLLQLHHENAWIVQGAIEALGLLGPNAKISGPTLAEMMLDHPLHRERLLKTIQQIDPTLPRLKEVLKIIDKAVRR